ncbi:type II secretion system minor pseudopilin GspK [Desulfopila inferna]|uniref:type II secretion system minor pseudopilin GspK n=1 Tax=Desulfopila inferna TaxID=468528 RepID=UPI001966C2FC|nr:type II secretion system minor pseudopilin GspK [Desulfopila inferna]MBM9606295.1 type II secretion system minor pseudopilin GspK [Desulfopila inferna]
MRRSIWGIPLNNRGVALLLAVTVISLLIAVTVQFSKDMRQELISSANLRESGKLGVMVKSGYNLAVAVLQQDSEENEFDSFHDGWAVMGTADLAQLYGDGKLDIIISDLSGRLQINSLVQEGDVGAKSEQILKALLDSGNLGEFSEEETSLIINAIVDWIDKNDEESGPEETESSYYLYREPAYSARNGPMEFIEELLLIRGVTSELFYGNEESPGLKDLLTVHGEDGRININTAPIPILKALSEVNGGTPMNDEIAETLITYRQNSENQDMLQEVAWYKNIPLGGVTFDEKTLTTSSSFFHVLSRAEHNTMAKSLEAVVQRQQGEDIAMLSRKVE